MPSSSNPLDFSASVYFFKADSALTEVRLRQSLQGGFLRRGLNKRRQCSKSFPTGDLRWTCLAQNVAHLLCPVFNALFSIFTCHLKVLYFFLKNWWSWGLHWSSAWDIKLHGLFIFIKSGLITEIQSLSKCLSVMWTSLSPLSPNVCNNNYYCCNVFGSCLKRNGIACQMLSRAAECLGMFSRCCCLY